MSERNGKRRKHRSEAQRADILRDWAASGLSGRRYAAERGLCYGSLLAWRKREGESALRVAGVEGCPASPSRPFFVEASVAREALGASATPTSAEAASVRLELWRMQASLSIDSLHGAHVAAHFLRALGVVC
jgi:hypothetical protein